MNYIKIYDSLVSRARHKKTIGYVEKHHVVPRCLGGIDAIENIVCLTAREHFIAHKLLTKIYPNSKGVWYALVAMGRITGFKSRIFSSERRKAADMRRGTVYRLESRNKMSLAKKGKPSNSPLTLFKLGEPSWTKGKEGIHHPCYGKKRTPEQRQKMSQAQLKCGNRPPSRKGVKWTEVQKASARVKRQKTQIKEVML
jgi:hypothetical protein